MQRANDIQLSAKLQPTHHPSQAPAPQADAPVPSRLQRKITKKAKFLTRVAESKSSALTSVRARIQKKGGHRPRALSMDELAKSLHDVDATAALHSTKQQGALQHMSGHSRGVNRRRAKTLYVFRGCVCCSPKTTTFTFLPLYNIQLDGDVTIAYGVAAPSIPSRPLCSCCQPPGCYPAPSTHPTTKAEEGSSTSQA